MRNQFTPTPTNTAAIFNPQLLTSNKTMKNKYKSYCRPRAATDPGYCARRDRNEKMEELYGYPMDLPKEENDLMPRRGIVQNLVFCALVVGIGTIIYFIVKS